MWGERVIRFLISCHSLRTIRNFTDLRTWQGVSRDGGGDRRTGGRVMGCREDSVEGEKNGQRLMDDRGWSPWSLGMVPESGISSPRMDRNRVLPTRGP
jgi:hypothetical protein